MVKLIVLCFRSNVTLAWDTPGVSRAVVLQIHGQALGNRERHCRREHSGEVGSIQLLNAN